MASKAEPGVGLTGTAGTAALQVWQAVADNCREALLRLFAGTAAAIALAHLQAMAVLLRHGRVVEQGDAPGPRGHRAGAGIGVEGLGGDQQAQGPDSAAVGVDPMGRGQHRGFAFTAELAQAGAQGLADGANGLRGCGHVAQAGPQGQGRGVHQGQGHVGVSAVAAAVDQAGFGGQFGFVDQGFHGQVGQVVWQLNPGCVGWPLRG